jgi:hypothetical protein
LAAVTVGSLLSIGLRWFVPLRPIAFEPGYYDAGLFERAAVALANHNWLGEFDVVTLSKGPSYPLFIAAVHRVGIPLQVGTQMVYLLGALSFAISLWLVLHRLVPATLTYLLIAFDPLNFGAESAGVMRDNIYAGLSLLFLSSLFSTVLLALRRTRLVWVLPAAVLAGGSGAAFWLCREEGTWIVPSALVVLVGLPLAAFLNRARTDSATVPSGRASALRLALVLVVVGATFLAPIGLIGAKNERVYGVNLTNDLSEGAFPRAYAAWSRVRGVPLTDYVPVNRAQREAVYQVSAAARELRATLEDPANVWNQQGCPTLGVCGDFAGGWEVWAFRDAALRAGHFDNEVDYQAFFDTLADEINEACDSGQLTCAPSLPASIQPLLRASIVPTLRSAVYWLGQLPVNDTYYTPLDSRYLFAVPDADRAILQQGIIGVAGTDSQAQAQLSARESWQWVYELLGWLFIGLFLVMLTASALGLALGMWWRKERSRNIPLWILSSSLAIAIATRLILFGVIDTTQYLVDPRYHYPTRLFLLALAAIGTIHCAQVIRTHILVRRAGGVVDPDNAPTTASVG